MENFTNAQKIFDFFKYRTDCLQKHELTVVPRYVVAIGDDPVSAYYACLIATKAKKQLGIKPRIICCGGYYQFSKYLNAKKNGELFTEGRKMAMICRILCPDFKIVLLDKSSDIVQSVAEIAEYLSDNKETDKHLLFCPTQRVSKFLERVVASSQWRFGTKIKAKYYVHGESVYDMLQAYNGMKFAGGALLLNEAAALYLHMTSYSHIGVNMEQMDFNVPKAIHKVGNKLAEKHMICYNKTLMANWYQGLRMWISWHWHYREIQRDLQQKIILWQKNLAMIK